jgi:hypothetical protein
MPYFKCRRCRAAIYSAAGHAKNSECPECEGALDRAQQRGTMPLGELRPEHALRRAGRWLVLDRADGLDRPIT